MPIPWDADILIFALTTAKIVLGGKKRLRESKRAIAVHDEMQEIREDALTKAQKEYIRPFDEQLAKLNYFRDFTYCVTNHRNYGQNLIRRYANPTVDKIEAVDAASTGERINFRKAMAQLGGEMEPRKS